MQMSSPEATRFFLLLQICFQFCLLRKREAAKVDFAPAKKKREKKKRIFVCFVCLFSTAKSKDVAAKQTFAACTLRHAFCRHKTMHLRHALCRHKTMQLAGVGSYHPGTQRVKKKANLNSVQNACKFSRVKAPFSHVQVQCCFTIRDGEPRTPASTFTQLQSSAPVNLSFSVLLYAHRDHKDC